jgi:hypothetical protein
MQISQLTEMGFTDGRPWFLRAHQRKVVGADMRSDIRATHHNAFSLMGSPDF